MSAEEQVRRSLTLYFQSLDNRDIDGVVGLFEEDARIIFGSTEVAGKPGITTWLSGIFANSQPNQFSRHISANPLITLNDASAEAVTDVAVLRCDENPWRVLMVTRHQDKLAPQTDGQWLFTEKRIEQVGATP